VAHVVHALDDHAPTISPLDHIQRGVSLADLAVVLDVNPHEPAQHHSIRALVGDDDYVLARVRLRDPLERGARAIPKLPERLAAGGARHWA